MLTVVTGGSGSGKSEYAENTAVKLAKEEGLPLYYIATMRPFGEEGKRRVERHRKLRAGKGFETIECYVNLENQELPERGVVLLECLSNWTANRMFAPGAPEPAACLEALWGELERSIAQWGHLVVVSNEIFSDGVDYDQATRAYLWLLGGLNRRLAQRAQLAVEVVCGLPVVLQGTLPQS